MKAEPAAIPSTPAAAEPDPVDLDLRGLRCPMPVLRTRKALQALRPGRQMRVSCTDPLASLDIPHLLGQTGDLLVAQSREGETQVFVIRKR